MHEGTFRRVTATIAALIAAALIAAGCGGREGGSGSSSGDMSSKSRTADTTGASHKTSGDPAISSPGVDLRLALDRLLAEHASVGLAGLTKTIAGEPDAQAAVQALQGNTDDLSAAIGSVYGEDAAEAFKTQWEAHIAMFIGYATGVARKDAAMKAKARKDLAGYQQSFARFLNEATGLPDDAGAAALGMHVQQLTRAMDAYGAGDYEKYYELEREAYEHMYGTGDALAAAISKQKPNEFGTGTVGQATADTRVLVNKQLGEHAYLAAVATTETLLGGKDAKAAVGALEANTAALGNTIESVYGPDAEEAFESQWRAHIGFFVDYASALKTNDQAKKDQAARDLEGYSENFARFLATTTDGDQDAYQEGLEEHVSQLAGALEAAKAGDAGEAWELEREAYAHMFTTGDVLVSAIVTQNLDRFPKNDGSAAAGGGEPTAHDE